MEKGISVKLNLWGMVNVPGGEGGGGCAFIFARLRLSVQDLSQQPDVARWVALFLGGNLGSLVTV